MHERLEHRFATGTQDSPVGRFVTARPPDSREPVRIGFFSCQDYQAGYYTALAGLAKEPDLDLIVCLGDYVYERTYYVGPPGRRDTLGANGDAEVQTLPEYRQKYRLYRTDADLQAIHSAAPFMAIWDDHEVEDDYASERPGEATGQVRVPFTERRRNAYLAFYENMPMEVVRADPNRLYRTLRLGGLLDLFLLDTRQYRDDQPCGDQIGRPCPEDEAPGRTLLGQTQKAWLKGNLESSRAAWKVVANQVMIMSLDAVPGVALNHDQWDGYGAERRELLGFVRDRAIKDVAFITGDIHTFFAGQVHPGGGQSTGPSVATEFVGGSVTSLGIGPTLGLSDQQAAPLVNNATALTLTCATRTSPTGATASSRSGPTPCSSSSSRPRRPSSRRAPSARTLPRPTRDAAGRARVVGRGTRGVSTSADGGFHRPRPRGQDQARPIPPARGGDLPRRSRTRDGKDDSAEAPA